MPNFDSLAVIGMTLVAIALIIGGGQCSMYEKEQNVKFGIECVKAGNQMINLQCVKSGWN